MKIEIRNATDARILAARYGMTVAERQGRFPVKRLQQVAAEFGDELVLHDYAPGSEPTRNLDRYVVHALVRTGRYMRPVEKIVTVEEIRNIHPDHGRGRYSLEDIANAAAELAGWQNAHIINVEKI